MKIEKKWAGFDIGNIGWNEEYMHNQYDINA